MPGCPQKSVAGSSGSVVGATACTAVTFGVCGVVIIGAAVAAGAAGAAVTYGLQSGSKSAKGMAEAVGWGAVGGAAGAGAGVVIGKIVGAVASKVVSDAGAQAASEASASAGARSAEDTAGIVYQRTELTGGSHTSDRPRVRPATSRGKRSMREGIRTPTSSLRSWAEPNRVSNLIALRSHSSGEAAVRLT